MLKYCAFSRLQYCMILKCKDVLFYVFRSSGAIYSFEIMIYKKLCFFQSIAYSKKYLKRDLCNKIERKRGLLKRS